MDRLDRWIEAALPQGDSLLTFRNRGEAGPLPSFDLAPGRILGDYRLEDLLGQGGMGQVWRARQKSLGDRPVALKVVRPDRTSAKHLEALAREALAGGRLSHDGIVRVLDFGTQGALAWIAMELVEGGWTLRDTINALRVGEVPADHERQVAALVATLADAIHAAHEAGIIHRDLKPQNVFLTPEGRPKIGDFGLARVQEEATLTRDLAGTLAYMSPEQLNGSGVRVDRRADVFALGVLLYELLTLERPFRGDTYTDLARRILREDPLSPRRLRPRIPRDLELITLKALRKPRPERYATAAELAADLRRFLAHEPILAAPPSLSQRVTKWVRRKPTAAVGIALGLAVTAALGWNLRTNRILVTTAEELERRTEALVRRAAELQAAYSDLAAEKDRVERERRRAQSTLDALEAAFGDISTNQMAGVLSRSLAGSYVPPGAQAEGSAGSLTAREFSEALSRTDLAQAARDLILKAVVEPAERTLRGLEDVDPIGHANALSALTGTCYLLGAHDMAVRFQERCLEEKRRVLGPEHREVIQAQSGLIGNYINTGRAEEALDLALDTCEKARCVLGIDDPLTLQAQRNLADVLNSTGRSAEAIRILESAIPQGLSVLAPSDPILLDARRELAEGYVRTDDSLAALREFEEVVRQAPPERFEEDEGFIEDYFRLSLRIGPRVGDEQARSMVAEAYGRALIAFGAHAPLTFRIAAQHFYSTENDAALAEAYAFVSTHPGHSIEWKVCGNALAALYRQQGRLDRAESIAREVLDHCLSTFGESHRYTIDSMAILGDITLELGLHDEARDLWMLVHEARASHAGRQTAASLPSLEKLARAQFGCGRFSEAAESLVDLFSAMASLAPEAGVSPVGQSARRTGRLLLRRVDPLQRGREPAFDRLASFLGEAR